MFTYIIKTFEVAHHVRADEDGTISFEYVIVAACVVGTASAVLGGSGGGTIQGALTAGLAAISNVIAGAV